MVIPITDIPKSIIDGLNHYRDLFPPQGHETGKRQDGKMERGQLPFCYLSVSPYGVLSFFQK